MTRRTMSNRGPIELPAAIQSLHDDLFYIRRLIMAIEKERQPSSFMIWLQWRKGPCFTEEAQPLLNSVDAVLIVLRISGLKSPDRMSEENAVIAGTMKVAN